jgi:hypothetical protein
MIILGLMTLLGVSCDEGGDSVSTSRFVAVITQAEPTYIAASAAHPFDWLESLFAPNEALALPNLGIPAGEFSGPYPVPNDTLVTLVWGDGATIASSRTDGSGRVIIDNVPDGYINVLVQGGGGKIWHMTTHIDPDHDTYMEAVLKDNDVGQKAAYAKSVHNDSAASANVDGFSITVLGKPEGSPIGGMTIIHDEGRSLIDGNGDGDYTDAVDKIIDEADDDGISSAQGDGDEDNDGITDNKEQDDEDDLDGDGIPNNIDTDDDGDGIPDSTDTTPRGITEFDDFVPPALIDPGGDFEGDPYTGIADAQLVWVDVEQTEIDPGKVRVYFPGAEDEMNGDVWYRIYYDDNEIDFDDSPYKIYEPEIAITDPEELYDFLLTSLDTDETWYFAIRALDSAPPPNEDENEEMLSLELPS